jgi:hypothetical protein
MEETVFNNRNLPSGYSDVEDSPSKLEGFHVLLTNGWVGEILIQVTTAAVPQVQP